MDLNNFVLEHAGRFVNTTLAVIEEFFRILAENSQNKALSSDFKALLDYAEENRERYGRGESPIMLYPTKDFTENDFLSNSKLKNIPMTVFPSKESKDGLVTVAVRDCDKDKFIEGVLEIAAEKIKITRISPETLMKHAYKKHQNLAKATDLSDIQVEYLTHISKKSDVEFNFTAVKDDKKNTYSVFCLESDVHRFENALLNMKLMDNSLSGFVVGDISLKIKNNVLSEINEQTEKNKRFYVVDGSSPANYIEFAPREMNTENGKKLFGNFTLHTPDTVGINYSEYDILSLSNDPQFSNRYAEELGYALSTIEKPILLDEERYKALASLPKEDFQKNIYDLANNLYEKTLSNDDDKAVDDAQQRIIRHIQDASVRSEKERKEKDQVFYSLDVVKELRNGNYAALGLDGLNAIEKSFLDEVRDTLPSVLYQIGEAEKMLPGYSSIDDIIASKGEDDRTVREPVYDKGKEM